MTAAAVVDGRHHPWLSALVERLSRRGDPVSSPQQLGEQEPIVPEPWDVPELHEYLVTVPADLRANRAGVLLWLQSFVSASAHAAFEVSGSARRVDVRIALPPNDASHILGQLRAVLPQVTVTPATDSLPDRFAMVEGTRVSGVELGLASESLD